MITQEMREQSEKFRQRLRSRRANECFDARHFARDLPIWSQSKCTTTR